MIHPYLNPPLANRPRAKMHSALVLLLLLASSFLLGVLVGFRYPSWVQSLLKYESDGVSRPLDLALSPLPVDSSKAGEEKSAVGLLQQLAAQLNQLERREAQMQRERREAEVALHLFASKGQAADAPACREQEAKLHAAVARLEQLREEKKQIMIWRNELRQVQSEDQPPSAETALASGLEQRIRIYLTRHSLLRELSFPDAEKGTAKEMTPNSPIREFHAPTKGLRTAPPASGRSQCP